MPRRRHIEIFSSGCSDCESAISLIHSVACGTCRVTVHDVRDPAAAARAGMLRIRAFPAMVVDGKLLRCCVGRGPDEVCLRSAGIGQPLT